MSEAKIKNSTALSMVLLFSMVAAANAAEKEQDQSSTSRPIEEVVVKGTAEDRSEPSPQILKFQDTAGTLGDPLRAVFSLPGIVQVDDETSEPAVRGSGPQDNEFIVDFLPTGNIFHIFGNSIFDEDLLYDFGINRAGFGADHGYATGAIFDVSLRDPRAQPISPSFELSFLQAGILVEGELAENHTFYANYRESLIHHFLDEDDDEDDLVVNKQPQTRDFLLKYLWKPNANHKLAFNVTHASNTAAETTGPNSDEALLDPGGIGRQSIDTEFTNYGVVWDFQMGPWTAKTALGYLDETFSDRLGERERQDVSIDQWTLRSELSRQLGAHSVKAGLDIRRQELDYDLRSRQQRCSDFSPGCDFEFGQLLTVNRSDSFHQSALYVEDQWSVAPNWTLTTGLRVSRDDYLNERFVEPRVRIDYQQNPDRSFYFTAGRYHQQPQANEMISVFGNPNLKSPTSDHFVFGVSQQITSDISATVDVYYKNFDNLVVATADGDARNFINGADGSAYGIDMMLEKERTDRWYGWLSASWSKTERTIDSTGETSPYFTDAPWVVNLVANYQLNPKWHAGLRWTYRSGLPFTPIIGNRPNPEFPGNFLPTFGALNSDRASAYHRLDVRLERSLDLGWADGAVFIDIINAYNNDNFRSLEYEPVSANNSEFRLVREPGLEFFPSIGLKLRF